MPSLKINGEDTQQLVMGVMRKAYFLSFFLVLARKEISVTGKKC